MAIFGAIDRWRERRAQGRAVSQALAAARRGMELDALRGLLRGGVTDAGVSVTDESARRLSAVFGCLRVLAWTIGTLPVHVYRTRDGRQELADDHRVARLLRRPNDRMTGVQFLEMMQAWITGRGNAFAEKIYNRGGQLESLWPWPSTSVRVTWKGWTPTYELMMGSGQWKEIPEGRVLHLRGLTLDGRDGVSALTYAREAVGMGLAENEFGARRFSNDARPGIVFKPKDGVDVPKDERTSFLDRWKENHQGVSKALGADFLPSGIDIQEVGMTSRDSQWLESRRFSVEEVCRFFGVPPSKLFSYGGLAYKNAEAIDLAFAKETILPQTISLEDQLEAALFTAAERDEYSIKFSLEGLLRATPEVRAAFYGEMSRVGAMSPDEIRAKENLPPIDGGRGDVHLVPLNMVALEGGGADGARLRLAATPGQAQGTEGTQRPQGTDGAREHQTARHSRRQIRSVAERAQLRSRWEKRLVVGLDQAVRGEVRSLKKALARDLDSGWVTGVLAKLDQFYGDGDLDLEVAQFVRGKIRGVFGETIESLGGSAASEIGVADAGDLVDWIDGYVNGVTRSHLRSSTRQLQDLCASAGPDGVKEEVERRMAEWVSGGKGMTRAEKVAAREVVQVDGAIARHIWRSNGITRIRWIANSDACPICSELDGQVVGIESAFVPAGGSVGSEDGDQAPIRAGSDVLHPPLHAGCGCSIAVE